MKTSKKIGILLAVMAFHTIITTLGVSAYEGAIQRVSLKAAALEGSETETFNGAGAPAERVQTQRLEKRCDLPP